MKSKKTLKIISACLAGTLFFSAVGVGLYFLLNPDDGHKTPSYVEVDPEYDREFKGRVSADTNSSLNSATEGLEYRINKDASGNIIQFDGTDTLYAVCSLGSATAADIIIPETYTDADGTAYTVIGLDYSAFANNITITSLAFQAEDNIQLLDAQALACCPNLSKFNSADNGKLLIPSNLPKVSSSCFMGDSSFTSLSFSGDKVASIRDNAFNGCYNLKSGVRFLISSANATAGVTIGDAAFANCKNVTSFIMPTGISSIGDFAFYNDEKVTLFTIPSSCTSIGSDAFRLCTAAKAFIGSTSRYPTGWPSDGTDSGNDTLGTDSVTVADWNYASNKYAIPIKTDMDNVNIDNTGTYMYSAEYDTAYNFWRITIISYLLTDSASVTVPQCLKIGGDLSYTSCLTEGSDQIGVVVGIGEGCFASHSEITSLTLPNTIEIVHSYAFWDSAFTSGNTAPNIETITMNDKNDSQVVNSVLGTDGTCSFADSVITGTASSFSMDELGLTGMVTIQDSAFNGTFTTGTTSIIIPSTVKTIGAYAFLWKPITSFSDNPTDYYDTYKDYSVLVNLETLSFGGTSSQLVSIGQYAFTLAGNKITTATCDLVLPATLSNTSSTIAIGSYAFLNCNFIKSLEMTSCGTKGSGVIGTNAFKCCTNMEHLILSDRISTLQKRVFHSCASLQWVYIPVSFTSIEATYQFGGDQYSGNNLTNLMPHQLAIYCEKSSYTGNWNKDNHSIVRYYDENDSTSINCSGNNKNDNNPLIIYLPSYLHPTTYNLSGMVTITNDVISTYPTGASITTNANGIVTTSNYIVYDKDLGIQYYYNGTSYYITKILTSGTCDLSSFGTSNVYINAVAAYKNTSLTKVNLGSISLKSIGVAAFLGCTCLADFNSDVSSNTGAIFPTSLTTYGSGAFFNSGITSISHSFTSSTSVSLGDYVFYACSKCTSFTLTNVSGYTANSVSGGCGLYKGTEMLYMFGVASGDKIFTIASGTLTIAKWAFAACQALIVVIPDSVTTINDYAFHALSTLQAATITKVVFGTYSNGTVTTSNSSSLATIGKGAFGCQIKLTSVALPNNPNLQSETNGITTPLIISTYAFHNCTALVSFSFPSTTLISEVGTTNNTLPNGIFFGDTNLESIDLTGIKHIADSAFSGDTKLASVTFGNVLEDIGDSAFKNTSITTLAFGSNLTIIGASAFEECTQITSIDFTNASSLATVGDSAFKGLTGLTSLDLTGATSFQTMPDNCFYNCTSLASVDLGTSLTSIGSNAFFSLGYYKTVTVLDFSGLSNLTTIGDSAFLYAHTPATLSFEGCTSLTTITSNAFKGTLTETSVSFKNCAALQTIGTEAFEAPTWSGTSSLASVDFTGCTGLTTLGMGSFAYTKITSLDLSDCTSALSIGSYTYDWIGVFQNCTELATVTLPDSVTTIQQYAFRYCSSLTSIRIPNGTTVINNGVFNNDTALKSVYNLSHVTSIGEYAFGYCTSLVSTDSETSNLFIIPDSVTTMSNACFQHTGIVNLQIGVSSSGLAALPTYCFDTCSSLVKVVFKTSSSFTTIGSYCFNADANLTNTGTSVSGALFELPSSVNIIKEKAFLGCTGLTSFYISASYSTSAAFETYIFSGCSTNLSIYIKMTYANLVTMKSNNKADNAWNYRSSSSMAKTYFLVTSGTTYTSTEAGYITSGNATGYFYLSGSTITAAAAA